MKQQVAEAGLEFDAYLKGVKKAEADIRTEWKEGAHKRVLGQLVLRAIGVAEHVEVPKDILTEEVNKLVANYPDASREAAELYVHEQLMIEYILQKLENL